MRSFALAFPAPPASLRETHGAARVGLFSFLRKDKMISRLTVVPPQAAPGRRGLAIAACVKDEARHLAEWLAFHRGIGVRAVFLYDDGSSDGSAAIAARFAP